MELIAAPLLERLRALGDTDPAGTLYVLEDPSGALGESAAQVLVSSWGLEHEKRSVHPDGARWSVTEIRDLLLDPVAVYPERRHVFIVAEADEIDTRAVEKLLRTLEEPPSPAVFVLLVRDRRRLLSTVLSRAADVIRVDPAPAETVSDHLSVALGSERAARLGPWCAPVVDLALSLREHPELDDDLVAVLSPPDETPFTAAAALSGRLARVASAGRSSDIAKLQPREKAVMRRLLREMIANRRAVIAAAARHVDDPTDAATLHTLGADLDLVEAALRANSPLGVVLVLVNLPIPGPSRK